MAFYFKNKILSSGILILVFICLGFQSGYASTTQEYLDLAKSYWYSYPDSNIYYSQLAASQAQKENDSLLLAHAYKSMGIGFTVKNDYTKAFHQYAMASMLYKRLQSVHDYFKVQNNIGLTLLYQNEYSSALKYFSEYKKYLVKQKPGSVSLARVNQNLGEIYSRLEKNQLAMSHYFESAKIQIDLEDSIGLSHSYLGIAHLFNFNLNNNDSAIKYYLECQKLSDDKNLKARVLHGMSVSYNNIEIKEARCYLDSAIDIYIEMGNKMLLADAYLTKAEFNIDNNLKYIDFLQRSVELSRKEDNWNILERASKKLFVYYNKINDFEKALYYLQLQVSAKEEYWDYQIENEIGIINEKHNYEIKEAVAKAEFEKASALQQAKVAKHKLVSWLSVGGFLLLCMVLFGIYRILKITRKNNRDLEQKNATISEQSKLLKSRNHLIENQKEEIQSVYETVKNQHQEMLSSVEYAQKIQSAILNPNNPSSYLQSINHFIYFKPRDIVSGDFYWMHNHENYLYIAMADCTGHGVPGAFMSMLGMAFLQEIVALDKDPEPAEILNVLRSKIIRSLANEEADNARQDGMDMGLVRIDLETHQALFAGANRPLWIVSTQGKAENAQKQTAVDHKYLLEFKGDRMPVGRYEKLEEFGQKTIQLTQGDRLYLFSDGFADQFSQDGQKMKIKRFRELITRVQSMPMNQQQEKMRAFFENWMGGSMQMDDVSVIGLEI